MDVPGACVGYFCLRTFLPELLSFIKMYNNFDANLNRHETLIIGHGNLSGAMTKVRVYIARSARRSDEDYT